MSEKKIENMTEQEMREFEVPWFEEGAGVVALLIALALICGGIGGGW